MINDIDALSRRERAIIAGIFLSKFGRKVLAEFGFSTFRQAFNVLGYATDTKPSSVKLYRDEFDSLFPNGRHGWNRSPREYCTDILKEVDDMCFDEFAGLIKAIVVENKDIILPGKKIARSVFSAQRLITGETAERYFTATYGEIPRFRGYDCHDTTKTGCGFDFRLSNGSMYFCVEVKGMNERHGTVMLTEKEYETAKETGDRYCLFIVRNFKAKPEHIMFFNPANNAGLAFSKHETTVIQTSYNTSII